MTRPVHALVGLLVIATASPVPAQTLKGSTASMRSQNRVAHKLDYTFLRTSAQVRKFVDLDLLVPLRGNADYALASVSHPFARPAVRTFVERLSRQYRSACGEQLVVTSLTRPTSEQPANASELSVHPAGMAVDLRVSDRSSCRRWLESTLMSLEQRRVLEATREHRPPHYHVALYPETYVAYVDKLTSASEPTRVAAAASKAEPVASGPNATSDVLDYKVNRGDSLWSIARQHGTTVEELKAMNGLRTSRIAAGQVLAVPASSQQQ